MSDIDVKFYKVAYGFKPSASDKEVLAHYECHGQDQNHLKSFEHFKSLYPSVNVDQLSGGHDVVSKVVRYHKKRVRELHKSITGKKSRRPVRNTKPLRTSIPGTAALVSKSTYVPTPTPTPSPIVPVRAASIPIVKTTITKNRQTLSQPLQAQAQAQLQPRGKKCVAIMFHKNLLSLYKRSWVERSVRSVLNQTVVDFEIYEINYGDDDKFSVLSLIPGGIKQKTKFFSKSLPDHTYAMNFLINAAVEDGADVIFNVNLDDVYNSARFEKQLECIDSGYELISNYWSYIEEIDGVDKETKRFDKAELFRTNNTSPITQEDIMSSLSRNSNVINHSSMCMSVAFWKKFDNNGNRLRYRNEKPYEDLTLWKRAEAGVRFKIVPEILVYYRIHSNSICGQQKLSKDMIPVEIKRRVGILLVATGKYRTFIQPLVVALEKNFLPDCVKHYFISTDDNTIQHSLKVEGKVFTNVIYRKGFPKDTLYRYHYFLDFKDELTQQTDVVYYMDVDMDVPAKIGNEILPSPTTPLVGVKHPGFYSKHPFGSPWGCPETSERSTAYVPPQNYANCYIAGGFNGGYTYDFLTMAKHIAGNVDIDDSKDVTAIWHDESHLNCYYSSNAAMFKVLPPDYCYPESSTMPFTKKIVALDKNHNLVRNLSENKYVSIDMVGGIGNLLFKVAMTYSIADKYGLQPVFAYIKPTGEKRCSYKHNLFRNLYCIDTQKIEWITAKETGFSYSPVKIQPNSNIMLNGYFQSYKYITPKAISVLNEMVLHTQYTAKQRELANSIYQNVIDSYGSTNIVSVHVRLTDYYDSSVHMVLPAQYYKAAMDTFPGATFLVFSDDPVWVTANMFKDCPNIYVLPSSVDDVTSLFLMMKCPRKIIANSTFSLWSAYLSSNQKVICPSKWFGPTGPKVNLSDLYRPEWTII